MHVPYLLIALVKKLLEYIRNFSLLLLFHYSKLPLRILHFENSYFVGFVVFYVALQDDFGYIMAVNAQDCSEKPVILKAMPHAQPVYFYTKGYENGRYDNNMRCSWILAGSNSRKRIMLTVHDSSIDDALFSQCDDYCSVYDGDTLQSSEIVRWCGDNHPDAIISTTDSLYVYFHSDENFQGRGVNMSFVEFDIPGCPPNWISSSAGYCYVLKKPEPGLTWLEAQKECILERSNLLTLTTANEYSSVAAIYAKNKTFPWIGYTDFNSERRFVSVDPNSGAWPEDLPKLTKKHVNQDCVYMDWNNKDGNVLATDDCRNRHEYVCKRRQDGSTIPYPPQEEIMRTGLQKKPSTNFTIWLFLLLLLLLLLVLLYLCYQKCKKQRALSRIGSSDINQRLVTGVDAQQATTSGAVSHLGGSELQKTEAVPANNGRPNSGAKLTTRTASNDCEIMQERNSSRLATESNIPSQNPHFVRQLNLERIEPTVLTIEPSFNSHQPTEDRMSAPVPGRSKINAPFGGREGTISSNTREETLLKIRRGELFERPRLSVLDHTSAISLDEFWNKNEISTISRT